VPLNIGISTLSFAGMSWQVSIETALQLGFTAFELVPYVYKPPAEFSSSERASLAKALRCFSHLTLHSSQANGASLNDPDSDVNRKSLNEYLELLHFAIDLAIPLAGFHQTSPIFEELAGKYAKKYGIEVIIESFDEGLDGKNRPGMLFDIGHAAMAIGRSTDVNEELFPWIKRCLPNIREFHIHGVACRNGVFVDHLPLGQDNIIDYQTIRQMLQNAGYSGYANLEIVRSPALEANLRHSQAALDLLMPDRRMAAQ
jgi:sugar phosphate isomerase/epimerase